MKYFFQILLLMLSLYGCSKSDDTPVTEQNFSVTATVSGESFQSQGFGSVLAEYKILENGLYQFALVASTEPNKSEEYSRILIRVILPGSGFLNENLGVADNQTGAFSNPFCFYEEVELGTDLRLDYADTEATRIASFTVTQIDSINKTISGTFRFTANSTIFNRIYEVQEGVFNKVTYKDLTEN